MAEKTQEKKKKTSKDAGSFGLPVSGKTHHGCRDLNVITSHVLFGVFRVQLIIHVTPSP